MTENLTPSWTFYISIDKTKIYQTDVQLAVLSAIKVISKKESLIIVRLSNVEKILEKKIVT